MNAPLRAHFQKNYLMRYLVLASICLFMGSWFAYDGLIGYPRQLQYAREYEQLAEIESEERQARWQEITSERGWPDKTPEKSAEAIQDDISGQYFWAILNLAIGLPALVMYLRSRGSWIEETESGLRTSWGQEVDFSTVSRLDKKKWSKKGIAKATYGGEGLSRTFVFDDFKFEREPLGKMLCRLESQLAPEQITGGPPELSEKSEPSEEAAEGDVEDTSISDDTPAPNG